jgi:hypothetical protein
VSSYFLLSEKCDQDKSQQSNRKNGAYLPHRLLLDLVVICAVAIMVYVHSGSTDDKEPPQDPAALKKADRERDRTQQGKLL